ncbi:MAG: ROK family protein [Candidatus Rokuibacteriota bacterium]
MTIGIDVGGTSISGGLVTDEGEVLTVVTVATHRNGRGTAVETVFTVVDDLLDTALKRAVPLTGVAIGLPGLIDVDKGMMLSSQNFVPEFAQLPLAEDIRQRTGLPAFVDNDVNMLALGEWMFGLGRGASSFVLLALGTGPGGGIIVGETLIRGHAGAGGEFGHVPVDLDGPLCRCGAHGCVSRYLSGSEIARLGRQAALEAPGSILLSMAGGDAEAITAALVFAAATAGDAGATALVARVCQALGAALGVIVNTINPEIIVVTGGVTTSLARLEDEVRRHTARYALAAALAPTAIHLVPGDKRQTVRGGAALVRYELARRQRRQRSGHGSEIGARIEPTTAEG